MKTYSNTIFNSRISKKLDKNLNISFNLEEEELDFIIKLFQAFKKKDITKQLSIEAFVKELIFDNVEYFKKMSDYDILYGEKKK